MLHWGMSTISPMTDDTWSALRPLCLNAQGAGPGRTALVKQLKQHVDDLITQTGASPSTVWGTVATDLLNRGHPDKTTRPGVWSALMSEDWANFLGADQTSKLPWLTMVCDQINISQSPLSWPELAARVFKHARNSQQCDEFGKMLRPWRVKNPVQDAPGFDAMIVRGWSCLSGVSKKSGQMFSSADAWGHLSLLHMGLKLKSEHDAGGPRVVEMMNAIDASIIHHSVKTNWRKMAVQFISDLQLVHTPMPLSEPVHLSTTDAMLESLVGPDYPRKKALDDVLRTGIASHTHSSFSRAYAPGRLSRIMKMWLDEGVSLTELDSVLKRTQNIKPKVVAAEVAAVRALVWANIPVDGQEKRLLAALSTRSPSNHEVAEELCAILPRANVARVVNTFIQQSMDGMPSVRAAWEADQIEQHTTHPTTQRQARM